MMPVVVFVVYLNISIVNKDEKKHTLLETQMHLEPFSVVIGCYGGGCDASSGFHSLFKD